MAIPAQYILLLLICFIYLLIIQNYFSKFRVVTTKGRKEEENSHLTWATCAPPRLADAPAGKEFLDGVFQGQHFNLYLIYDIHLFI